MRQIVGTDDLMGYDDIAGQNMVGAAGTPMITSRRTVGVQEQAYTKWRRQILPIPATVVPAGGTATIQVQPQRLFKGKKLSLVATDGAGVTAIGAQVTDVKIGQNSQFVSSGNVAVEVFAPDSVSSYVDLDDADIGNLVTVFYANPTAAAITVEGGLFGVIVE